MRARQSVGIRLAKAAVVPVLAIAGTVYFAGHAVYGDYGLDAKMRLERETETARRELLLVREERQRLEQNVALMRPESLDPDLLEERVRSTLQFVSPSDVVVLTSTR